MAAKTYDKALTVSTSRVDALLDQSCIGPYKTNNDDEMRRFDYEPKHE